MFKVTPKLYGKKLKQFYRLAYGISTGNSVDLPIKWMDRPFVILNKDQLDFVMTKLYGGYS